MFGAQIFILERFHFAFSGLQCEGEVAAERWSGLRSLEGGAPLEFGLEALEQGGGWNLKGLEDGLGDAFRLLKQGAQQVLVVDFRVVTLGGFLLGGLEGLLQFFG